VRVPGSQSPEPGTENRDLRTLPVRAVLFDLDDTLFDHHNSARAALREVHRAHASGADFAELERHHIRYLEEMHVEVLAGRIGLDDARRERFRRVFAALGVSLDAGDVDAVASAYRTGYLAARRALDGAPELLAAVRRHARVAIVTNNLLDEQRGKLEHCGLAPFVDALVVSDDVGVSKPDPRIFRIALDRVGAAAADAVMVGDSWGNDVVGARAARIRAVWFNPGRRPMPADPPGVADIHSLTPAGDVLAVLSGEAHQRS
jgi:putative hydrolase of the HAD superfamily